MNEMYCRRKDRVLGHSVLAMTLALTGNLVACGGSPPAAQWARTVLPVQMDSFYYSVAVDSSGSVYAAGELWGTGTLNFGNNVTASGAFEGYNVLLVKYDSSGTALWAQTFTGNSNYSSFSAVAGDSTGNVYAAGSVSTASGAIDVGSGVTLTASNADYNAVLVKYNSLGVPQWARTVASGPDVSGFTSVAVDSAGNVYAAGSIGSAGTYDFGNNVTVASTVVQTENVVLVKYTSSGVPQWAQTVTSGTGPSFFESVAVDAAGSVYAAGAIAGAYDFGNGVTASGLGGPVGGPDAGQEGGSVLLVKYSSSGTAQWAQTITSSPSDSGFTSVAVDAAGSVYAAGYVTGTLVYDFGNGVTATGTSDPNFFYGLAAPQSLVLVKYDASGVPVWAQTVSNGERSGILSEAVAIDSSGNVFAAGSLVVKFSSSGISQLPSAPGGSGYAPFAAVSVDAADNVYVVGGIGGAVDFGNNVSATGADDGTGSGWSALLVKYR